MIVDLDINLTLISPTREMQLFVNSHTILSFSEWFLLMLTHYSVNMLISAHIYGSTVIFITIERKLNN